MSPPATDCRETLENLSSRLRRLPTTLLLLGGLVAIAPMGSEPAFGSDASATTLASGANAILHDRELSFESRVDYQYRIEEVYWQHRNWPKENPGPKPPLDAVIRDAQIRAKVEDYLRKSNALEALWGRGITEAQLQAEMDRMAAQSRAPEVLRELFDALGNDPFVIAETLARQTLADRLIRSWYARDERFHGELRRQAEAALAGVSSGAELRSLGAEYAETTWRRYGEDGIGAERLAALPVGTVSPLQEDDAAFFVTSVVAKDAGAVTVATASWTKTSFDAWWAEQSIDTSADLAPARGEFVLAEIEGVSVCVPDRRRYQQTAVWTGAEMIVWGGSLGGSLNTSERYIPSTDSWVATTLTAAPSPRTDPTAVWTGTEMIVWGGWSGNEYVSSGGRYGPTTDEWIATATFGAPSARGSQTAVWTGNEMIVRGGDGGRYDPSTDRWLAAPTIDAHLARRDHEDVACAPESPRLSVLGTSSVSAQAAGLVAAYGFEAVSGTTAIDSSGNGNTGSLLGASWNAQGKFGSAVQTGPGARVSVANSPSLGLTTAATLEAWVYPFAHTSNWSTVIMKEQSGALAYVLYSDGNTAQPSGRVHISGAERYATGGSRPAVNTWTHLATTYDGATLALYINGTPVASTAQSGLITSSSQPLGIGGNGVWGESFTGLIDEVRIYNRALTQAEIQTDMVTPVSAPDSTAPSVSLTNPTNGTVVTGTINVTANATDDVVVAGVQFRLDGAALGAEDTTAPYQVAWNTFTTTNGSHALTAVARDGAGNVTTSSQATITVDNVDPPSASPGLLYVDPQNPRYFTDGTGKSVLLVGSHTWANFVDNGLSDPPRSFDYASYLDFLQVNNLNFFRLWTWEQAKWNTWTSTAYWFAPSPYPRTGPGTALDGKPKFNLGSFNQAYFDRLRQHVIDAGAKGIYASIMLFQGWGVGDRTDYPGNPWSGHPFNAANNASGVNGDLNGDGRGGEVHTMASASITALQDAYVRKVIDTVNDLDNVLYEICNECNAQSIDWQNHMIALIKSYEAGKPKRHPVGFTGDFWYSNATLFSSNADWISPGAGQNGSAYLDSPPPASGAKVIISDTDHLWGMGGDRTWVWKSITRGINTMIMDGFGSADYIAVAHPGWTTNDPNWVGMRANMGYARSYAQRMNLTAMSPRGDLTSTGYALASPTAATPEFLVYAPSGGAFTVNLTGTAGSFSVEWLRPATGATTSGASVAGGATRSFTPPFSGDAVLYLHGESSGTPDTQAPAVSMSAPANGATVSGTTAVSATATDNVGVVGVQFTLDGANLGAEDVTAPYAVSWNTTLAADGSHALSATARDAAGNTATTASVNVTVANTDSQAPTVSIATPTAGQVVSGASVTLSASASDNVGVVGVQFMVDGVNTGTEDVSAPYSVSWNSMSVPDGTHSVSARARDAAGNTATSALVNLTVANGGTVGSIVIDGGAAGTNSRWVTLTLAASDVSGPVTQMRFSTDGTAYSAQEAYATTKAWRLSGGSGTKAVYAQFRTATGNWSTAVSDTIVLNTLRPRATQ